MGGSGGDNELGELRVRHVLAGQKARGIKRDVRERGQVVDVLERDVHLELHAAEEVFLRHVAVEERERDVKDVVVRDVPKVQFDQLRNEFESLNVPLEQSD